MKERMIFVVIVQKGNLEISTDRTGQNKAGNQKVELIAKPSWDGLTIGNDCFVFGFGCGCPPLNKNSAFKCW